MIGICNKEDVGAAEALGGRCKGEESEEMKMEEEESKSVRVEEWHLYIFSGGESKKMTIGEDVGVLI